MSYKSAFYLFAILFIVIFLIDYYIINKRKLYLIEHKGINKRGKKKKIKQIGEMDYLVAKFHLNKNKLNKKNIIIWISIINSFIISIVSALVMLMPFKLVWQLLIAFVLLFGLIYSLYDIYGKYLKKEEMR